MSAKLSLTIVNILTCGFHNNYSMLYDLYKIDTIRNAEE